MTLGLKGHLVTIARHWGTALSIVAISFFIAGCVAFLSSKTYFSHARILVLSQSQVEVATAAQLSRAGEMSSPREQVLTQVQIVKSPLLAERLVLEIGPQRMLDEMTWRWDWLRALPGRLKDNLIERLAGWSVTEGLLRSAGMWPRPEGSGPPVSAAMLKFEDGLQVESITQTDMFVIAFEAPNPEFAAEVVDTLIDIYIDHVVYLRSPAGTSSIARQEAERLAEGLTQAETALREFSQTHKIVSIQDQKSNLLERVMRTQEELDNTQRMVLEADRRLEVLLERISSTPDDQSVTTTTRANPLLDRLIERLGLLRAEQLRFVPGSQSAERIEAEIRSLEAQIQNTDAAVAGSQTTSATGLVTQLQSNVAAQQAEREALTVRVQTTNEQLANVRSELQRLNELELQHRVLQREIETKEQAYRYAVQKREENVIASVLSGPSLAQVIPVEPATIPVLPASPRRTLLLMLGLIVGLMFGVLAAYLREFARSTVSTPKEAEFAFGRRVLASFWKQRRVIPSRARRNTLEMRRLATLLLHEHPAHSKARCISFTKLGEHDARRTQIEELAEAMRLQEAKVLYIAVDTDVDYRPGLADSKQHPNASNQAENEKGLADVSPVQGMGQMDRDAGHLLIKKPGHIAITGKPWAINMQLKSVLKGQQRDEWDYFLIDCPDIGDFPEQISLVSLVDAYIPIIEANKTLSAEAIATAQRLQLAGAVIPGIILNNQRHANSSWAFSWMAQSKRREQIAEAA